MEKADIIFQFCQIHRKDMEADIIYAIFDDICPGLINEPKTEKQIGKIIIQFDCEKWINLQTLINLWMKDILNIKGLFFNHLIELLISKVGYLHKNNLPHGFLLPSYIWIELDQPFNNQPKDSKIQNICFLNHQILFKDIEQDEKSFCQKQDINFIQQILAQILKHTSSQKEVFEYQSLESLRDFTLKTNFSPKETFQNQTIYDGQVVKTFLNKNSQKDCIMVNYLIITKFYPNIMQYIVGNQKEYTKFKEQNVKAITNLNPTTSQISLNWSQKLTSINQESFINFPKSFSEIIFCASNLDEYIELQAAFLKLQEKIEEKVQKLISQIESRINKFFKLNFLDNIKKNFYFHSFDEYFYLSLLEKNKQNHENLIVEIYESQGAFLEKFENLKLHQLAKEECLQTLKRYIEKLSNSLTYKQTF